MDRCLLPARGSALNRIFQRCFSGWNQVRAFSTPGKSFTGTQKNAPVPTTHSAHQAPSPHQAAAKRANVGNGDWKGFTKQKSKTASKAPTFYNATRSSEAVSEAPVAPPGPEQSKGLFSGAVLNEKTRRPSSRLVAMVRTVEEAKKAAQLLMELGEEDGRRMFAVDTETSGVDPSKQSPVGNGRVVCFSVYCGPAVDFARLQCPTLRIEEEEGAEQEEEQQEQQPAPSLPPDPDPDADKAARLWVDTAGAEGEAVMEAFRVFFESPKHLKVYHNYSFDSHVLGNHGIRCQGFGGDTVHMARLLDTSRALRGGYKLSVLCHELLGWGKTDMKKVFGKGALKKDGTEGKLLRLPDSLELHTAEDPLLFNRWVAYSTFDTLCTWFLHAHLEYKLKQISWRPDPVFLSPATNQAWSSTVLKDKKAGLHPKAGTMMDFYTRVWRPFGQVLVDMERAGMYLDTAFLEQQTKKAEEYKELADAKFREWMAGLCADGVEINTSSSLQKRHLLYSSRKVLLTIPKPIKNKVTGQQLEPGQEVELAWHDAEQLVRLKKAQDVGGEGEEPDVKVFTVKNTAGLVREGEAKPAATREMRLRGLRLRPLQYTATGMPSTASNVIQALAGKPFSDPPAYGQAFEDLGRTEEARRACEALGYLMEAEATEKLLNTFLRPLPQMVDAQSRIHSSVNLNTETGRLSSQRPNLQNQPALEKDRYQVRKAFRPAPGAKFIVADYGQLELRIMAHMTRCKSMIEALEAGGDFHSRTAIDMYAHVREAVEQGTVLLEPSGAQGSTPLVKDKFANERKSAKVVNFSIAYGKTKKGLAVDLNVTPDEAQETIDRWYDARKEVKEWQDRSKATAAREGYTATLLGRLRTLSDINSSDSSRRGHAQRGAINTPIQGGAADVVVMAMLKIDASEEIRALGWRMVMQIHDELILEGPSETAEQAFPLVKACMEHPFENPMLVKLPVDGGICDSWFEGK